MPAFPRRRRDRIRPCPSSNSGHGGTGFFILTRADSRSRLPTTFRGRFTVLETPRIAQPCREWARLTSKRPTCREAGAKKATGPPDRRRSRADSHSTERARHMRKLGQFVLDFVKAEDG